MPKPIKKRIKKIEHNETDIREAVEDIRERLRERQRTLVYGLAAFAVVVAAAAGFFIYTTTSTNKALELRYEGDKLYHGSTKTPFANPADRYKSALEKFKQSYAEKKNPVTLLYIANSYYELGSYDDAIKTLKELTSRYSDPRIAPLAYYKLAMMYLKKGDTANALATLNTIISTKDSPLQDMALLESGKILESIGKAEEAKGKYKELISKFPKSVVLAEAKARLESR